MGQSLGEFVISTIVVIIIGLLIAGGIAAVSLMVNADNERIIVRLSVAIVAMIGLAIAFEIVRHDRRR